MRKTVSLLSASLLIAAICWAQGVNTASRIAGRVVDQQGGVLQAVP
ncbi:MAG TPA: hypothetical protein VMH05_17640 [Bryobacteraceae bacterium]|nr:hypothetical protein [Bryobacteraceae bacterium]